MDFLDKLENKTIIVTPYMVKDKIFDYLNNKNKLVNVKLYTLEELKRNVFFDYDEEAILYLMEKYKYSYEVSKYYLDNLYYVEDKKYHNEKLDFLVNLKKELVENNLLTFNPLFIESYKNVPFIVFGYDYLSSFDKKILSNFNYKFIEKKSIEKEIPFYKFDTMEDEILFVINKIVELINRNVDINKIYLLNLDSSYNLEILKLFKMFNIPVDISTSSTILSTLIGKEAIEVLENTKSFEETLNFISSFGLNNELNSCIYKNFLNVFNKYNDLEYSKDVVISAVKEELGQLVIDNNILQNKVRVATLNNSYYDDDDYVFLLGFNQGSIPKVFKDEDYIDDSIKSLVGLDLTSTKNKMENEATINNLKAIKNIFVTYKLLYLDTSYYPSNLLSNSLFKEEKATPETSSSLPYSELKLSYMLDNLIKYNEKDENLSDYFNSFKIRYSEFDNKFKAISKESLYKRLDNKLTLSYSTIDTYYKCAFRYYIDNILKLNIYEETFYTILGSLFHYVLSHVYDDDFDLDKYYEDFLKDKTFNYKEKFYLNKLKSELVIVIKRLKDFYNDTEFVNVFTEKNIKIDKSSDIEVTFKGIVDKIMYKEEDDETLLSIIDYKTGSADININNSVYGIGMQLIIYLYLITKSNLFNNFKCVGFYLQRILSGEVNIEPNKTYEELKNDNLKLNGYSLDEEGPLMKFDKTYEDSEYIKSLKVTKNGFYAYSNVLSKEEMDDLVKLVDKKIDTARDLILNGDFSINPKWIAEDKEITGCQYCKYKDICFRKNEDIVNLKKYRDLSFLEEGEENA